MLAWNRLGHALVAGHLAFTDPDDPATRPNQMRLLFLDPHARELHRDWADEAASAVASLRFVAGQYPDDRALAELVGELSMNSREFALGLDAAAKKGYRGAWMMTSAAWCACLSRGRGSRPSSPARALDNPSSGRPANPLAHTVADVALGMYAVARYHERDDTSLPNADIGPGCRTSPVGAPGTRREGPPRAEA